MDETILHRIKNAVFFLKEGHSFKVGNLLLNSKGPTNITVTGFSSYSHLENLHQAQALNEPNETKGIFAEMIKLSKELSDFRENKQIEYRLNLDYDNGAVGICKETKGKLV